ncbi:MAG: proton-conducting transporter membrane subunit [Candidatus Omnitrophica bacterium]|nr:proton-conducting transporter membrane subunit [Candidatus Omnitrophota bacterium]
MNMLLLPILIPIASAIIVLLLPKSAKLLRDTVTLLSTFANALLAIMLFNKEILVSYPWVGFGFEFSLRLYNFSSFIMAAAASFGFLIALYSSAFTAAKNYSKSFFVYLLISLALLNGAVLSNNLLLMLFFWEALLITQFGMIMLGGRLAFRTATKAFVIIGASDLCMMVGIAIYGFSSGSFAFSNNMPLAGLGGLAFVLLMIGAIAKAGSMPFHSWIPDAAIDAPLPVVAMLPGALEKLLGIYFLTRISLDMFRAETGSWVSYLLMIVGSITILFAVMMALVQKDYKRLLSYHAISQIGYMVLGIGTFVPVGIVGGLFHMINNSMYKCCLFLTGGAVEKQAGTTNLEKLGGIGSKMPVTFACFLVTALAISGVPPFNGFFSKELVYDGALERGWIFYLAALVGSFFTAASFLKLGHAAYLGKADKDRKDVKEAPYQMLIPMVLIALACILFGVYNKLPIKFLIQPVLGVDRLRGHNYWGFPPNFILAIISVVVLAGAFLNHIYGVKKTGSGLKAVDHIYHAPVLSEIYDAQAKGYLDPYNIGLGFLNIFSIAASWFDKAVDWFYNVFSVKTAALLTNASRRLQNGNYKTYIILSMATTVLIVLFLLRSV